MNHKYLLKKGITVALASAVVTTSMPVSVRGSSKDAIVVEDDTEDAIVLEEIKEEDLLLDETSIVMSEGIEDNSGIIMSEELEDNGGITNHGAAEVPDYENGNMIEVTHGWNNQNSGHAEFNNAEELFQKESFTLLADVKITDTDREGNNPEKKAAFTIGNSENSIRLLLNVGKLGYGANNGGISAKQANLSQTTEQNQWSTVAIVYEENEESGLVTVYLNGEKVLEQTSLGFKLSIMENLQAYVGRSHNTSFLLNGIYDRICVVDAALTEEKVSEEATKRLEKKAEGEASILFQEDYEALQIRNVDDVRGNLPLVKEGKNGSSITWTSDRPDVITDSDVEDSLYDGGVVTRPEAGEEPVQVKLTAILTMGNLRQEKQFTVTVTPKTADLDTNYNAGYLWANFSETSGSEKIYYGYSNDGLNWKKLNKDENGTVQPILSNDAPGNDGGVRDPHIIRSAEGDKYWILGTDLHAEGGNPGGTGWNSHGGSKNIVVWESTDLVNWSKAELVFAGLDTAGCVWAPEAIYDEKTGDYLVYWSARDESKHDNDPLCVYLTRTRDFHTFSEPEVWLSEGEDNIIDSSIAFDEKEGKYYRFSTSDWNTVLDVSESLDGPWERLIARGEHEQYGFSNVEGFTCYQLPDGRWCAMGDNQGYKAFVTDDISSGIFQPESATFEGRFRHGTVMRLSAQEEARVMKAFGEKVDETPDPERKVLADFDFDDEISGFESENGKAVGQYALKDSYNESAGKAVYLDGSSNNFLTVTDMEGGSLLTGAKELTISYEMKPDRTNTNWTFYAASDENAPVYNSEKYLGIMEQNGATSVERYNNTGQRPEKPSASTGSDWHRVDVVVSKQDTSIYVNGRKIDTKPGNYTLKSILGDASILQIGKANWGGGEYFKGWIDNFRIENRALSEAEVQALAADFVDTLPAIASASVGTAPDRETALEYRGTDDHTSIFTKVDKENKVIESYVKKDADLTQMPLQLECNQDYEKILVDGKEFQDGDLVDVSEDVSITFVKEDKEETWTLKKPILSNNPVLPGQYADPDIDYFDGKFWIYPTTDGYPGWSGTQFHAFSSEDMVDWKDEGIILELANQNPGVNEQGVQIAVSPWAVGGSAWAPTIEKKNDKYYFYYCGKFQNGQSAIGVAVADNPAGPFTDKGTALLTLDMCRKAGVNMGQAIDPSIFTDDDGTSYILFGNGNAAMAELQEDMTSIKEGTLKQIHGLEDFRESVVVTKANGKYHWTWSCDDANSPNYHVNYGVSDQLFDSNGKIQVTLKKKNLLSKDESKGILGSAHQSVVHVKDADDKDRYFMAYHRFYTPLNIFNAGDGLGKHRETCIDEITFDENGEMQIAPTLEGVGEVVMEKETAPDPAPNPNPGPSTGGDDIIIDVDKTDEDNKIADLLEKDETGTVVTISGKNTSEVAEIIADVKEEGLNAGDKVTLYQYDEKADKLVDTGKTYTVGEDGKVLMEITADGTYVLAKVVDIKVGDVTAPKSVTTTKKAILTWEAVEDADSYRIYRYNRTTKKYEKIAEVKDNKFVDEDVKAGTGYLYKVRAVVDGKKNHFSDYTKAFRVLTKTASPTGVKAKRTSGVSSKATAEISFKKAAKATAYRIYKYDKKADKYQLTYQVKNGKLFSFNAKTKKFKKVGTVKEKNGTMTCKLTNLNLRAEKSQSYKVRSVIAKEKYTTQYSTMSKAVTIK